jgi:toxin YoeB
MFKIKLTDNALNHIEYFKKNRDKTILSRIFLLIEDIQKDPYIGLGKPEPLKYNLSGYWSRRINKEHRIVYSVLKDTVIIISIKGHY